MMFKLFTFLLFVTSPSVCFAQHTDTISVYFENGISSLNTNTKKLLDSLAYNEQLIPTMQYGIIGYADYTGSEESNMELSQQRALAVQAYLQGLGIKQDHIATVTGKGAVKRDMESNEGYPSDRRVDIIPGGFSKPVTLISDTTKKICRCGDENCKFSKKSVAKQIDLSAIKQGDAFDLDEIYFEDGRIILLKQSHAALDALYNTMAATTTLKIQIEGHVHCDLPGSFRGVVSKRSLENDKIERDYLLKLSQARAKTIYEFLSAKGIPGDRMKHIGLGCAGMDTHPGNNRRVTIRILNK